MVQEKGQEPESGLDLGLGLIIFCFSTNGPSEICAWGVINFEVCVRVSPGAAHT